MKNSLSLKCIPRGVKFLALVISAGMLQGCFWGFFGGSVKVQNDTDSTIYASIDRNNIDDGGYYPSDKAIDSGDSEYFPLNSLTFDPDVYVEYRNIDKTYHTSLNFFGYDIVYVNDEDFIHYSN